MLALINEIVTQMIAILVDNATSSENYKHQNLKSHLSVLNARSQILKREKTTVPFFHNTFDVVYFFGLKAIKPRRKKVSLHTPKNLHHLLACRNILTSIGPIEFYSCFVVCSTCYSKRDWSILVL